MDFFQINTRVSKGATEIYPDFVVGRSKDLMVRGRSFYAIWNEQRGLWSTDEYDVQQLIDLELRLYAEQNGIPKENVKFIRSFGNNGWNQFRKYVNNVSDNSKNLDEELTFQNTPSDRTRYASKRLPYSLYSGDCSAWDELVSTLYDPDERAKIEWAIGSVVSGDAKKIQKFLVFYGPPGTGKSTILNIIQKLFDGYSTIFEAKALGSSNNAFAMDVFKDNPLVAIQHDGDLSKIEDNTQLNSIVSHEEMTINEKYKARYTARINALLMMGTNLPVKISDAKSGIIRRLIDVHPTGRTLAPRKYHALMNRIDFELGAIAQHCLDVYKKMGRNYYSNYRPIEMMYQTNVFLNFVQAHYDIFKSQDGITLKQAFALYKQFCSETGIATPLPQYKLRTELRNYFDDFRDQVMINGERYRSYYSGFNGNEVKMAEDDEEESWLKLDQTTSIFDREMADRKAQLAKEDGTPAQRWVNVETTLSEIDTSQLHYVQVPENHIVIDFDLKDDSGGKSLARNLEAAASWPPTYAELSKSGAGIHLHYLWTGNESRFASHYADGIEVKVFSGNSSLRRRLSRCTGLAIAELSSGLPLKEEKVLHAKTIQSEKGLRDLIARNLRKEVHPGTKSSIDFIERILHEAYISGMSYDVTDLRGRIIAFANNSSNQALLCLKTVQRMRFKSDQTDVKSPEKAVDERLVFFDVEVYPNLLVVCWKYQGDANVVKMINPSPQEVEQLFRLRLVGFNNRRYDNHILYARFLGYDNEQLYKLSQKIVEGSVGALFGEAYNLSYTDIYDFSSKKQGLKKFQIELGIFHLELDIPWDQPVPQELWLRVVEYCSNDVLSAEKVFEARKQDFVARQILCDLSGLTPNDTTQKHTARIIFGDDRNPQRSFVYTELVKEFPGYEYDRGKSTYRGEVVGEGGYVYAEPGMYQGVALLDVASMHPTSISILNLFGEYTPRFAALTEARLAIKAKEYSKARVLLDGKLAKYLGSDEESSALAYALKIIINIVYGLTSAKFDNPFRDPRNKDNIVAKRGALFMIDLKHFVQEQGFSVAHIKTDSIKIPDATSEIIEAVKLFGEKYGYTFEHEATYDQFVLVNDAVYVGRQDECLTKKWTTVGAQFAHPYVFKTLFSHEEIVFDDLCETKQVSQGALYIDFDVEVPMVFHEGAHFVGRTGRFVPVLPGNGGGVLYRVKDGKPYAAAGTKGHLWIEADKAKMLGMDVIDMSYFERLADEAEKTIDYFGPFTTFVK